MLPLFIRILSFLNKFLRYFLYQITRKCEIERLCSNSSYSNVMSLRFCKSIRQSNQLCTFSKIMFYFKPFNVEYMYQRVIDIKLYNKKVTEIQSQNIKRCLGDLKNINITVMQLENTRKLIFSYTITSHCQDLDQLWTHLMPNTERIGGNKSCSPGISWEELGFQGKDPSTDFRGMGLLGLRQLLYFSKTRTQIARDILTVSKHPRRYFPFAATGINFTAFLLELCRETRIHSAIMKEVSKFNSLTFHAHDDSVDIALDEGDVISSGMRVVHEIYCDIYKSFSELWVLRDPRDIMSFPAIFNEIKDTYRSKYPPL